MEPENQPADAPDGAVDWEAANPLNRAAALTADGDDAGEAAAYEPRSFTYDGRTITAHSPAEAAALEQMIHENKSHRGRQRDVDAALRERLANVEGQLSATKAREPESLPEPEFPSIDLARQDPERWRADIIAYNAARELKIRHEIEQSVRTELSSAQEKAASEAAVRAWGEGFYTRHAHLDSPKRRLIVQGVYRENAKAIAEFGDDVEGAYERLAELSDAAIAEVAGAPTDRSRGDTTTRPPRLEGPSRASVKTPETTREHFTGAKWLGKERARMRGDAGKA